MESVVKMSSKSTQDMKRLMKLLKNIKISSVFLDPKILGQQNGFKSKKLLVKTLEKWTKVDRKTI